MKEFRIFFEHPEYGYYSVTEEAKTILKALKWFTDNYKYKKIYGIMEI